MCIGSLRKKKKLKVSKWKMSSFFFVKIESPEKFKQSTAVDTYKFHKCLKSERKKNTFVLLKWSDSLFLG